MAILTTEQIAKQIRQGHYLALSTENMLRLAESYLIQMAEISYRDATISALAQTIAELRAENKTLLDEMRDDGDIDGGNLK